VAYLSYSTEITFLLLAFLTPDPRPLTPSFDPRPLTPGLWWIVVGFIFVLGACVGSFLNVVVYRLPRGESLVRPASRCPKCGHSIRWYDNVPIASWIALRGRCRDCRAAISSRYAVVEAIVAFMFVLLAVAGPISSGNPPGEWFEWRGWLLFLLRANLGASALAVVLIFYDGYRVPRILWGLVIVFLLAAILFEFSRISG
jgi:leader peptidase (prepilin peptidase)/N-methyltransferase